MNKENGHQSTYLIDSFHEIALFKVICKGFGSALTSENVTSTSKGDFTPQRCSGMPVNSMWALVPQRSQ